MPQGIFLVVRKNEENEVKLVNTSAVSGVKKTKKIVDKRNFNMI